MKHNFTVDAHVTGRLHSLASQSGDEMVRATCRAALNTIERLSADGVLAEKTISNMEKELDKANAELRRLKTAMEGFADAIEASRRFREQEATIPAPAVGVCSAALQGVGREEPAAKPTGKKPGPINRE